MAVSSKKWLSPRRFLAWPLLTRGQRSGSPLRPFLVAVACAVIGCIIAYPFQTAIDRRQQAASINEAEQIANLAEAQIGRAMQSLVHIAAANSLGDEPLSSAEFDRFLENSSSDEHALLSAVAYIETIEPSEIAVFEAREQRLNNAPNPVMLNPNRKSSDPLSLVTRTRGTDVETQSLAVDVSFINLDSSFLTTTIEREAVIRILDPEIVHSFAQLSGTDDITSADGLTLIINYPARFDETGTATSFVAAITSTGVLLQPVLENSFTGGVDFSVKIDGEWVHLASHGDISNPPTSQRALTAAGLDWKIEVFGVPTSGSTMPLLIALAGGVIGLLLGAVMVASSSATSFLERHKELESLVITDVLTGLPNRAGFEKFVVSHVAADGTQCGVLMCDLDDFKEVNDTHGHDAGDHVLKVVAARLTDAVRDVDMVVRWGGDEFLIVLVDIDESVVGRLELAVASALDEPIAYGSEQFAVSLSVGSAIASAPVIDIPAVLRLADRAMYVNKFQAKRPTAPSGNGALARPTSS